MNRPANSSPRTIMMERIWPGAIVGENTLQVHISAVRKALGPIGAMLKTDSGRGYRLLGSWTPGSARRPQPVYSSPTRTSGAPPPNNFPAHHAPGWPGRGCAACARPCLCLSRRDPDGPGRHRKDHACHESRRASSGTSPTADGLSSWRRCPIPASCRPRWPARSG